MKKFSTILAVVFLSAFFVVGTASAELIPYWTLSHFETGGDYGTAGATIAIDITSNDNADFGLFQYQDQADMVTVFNAADGAGATATAVFELQTDNTWDLSVFDNDASLLDSSEDFGLIFGFYFEREISGTNRIIYSDPTLGDVNPSLNTMDMAYAGPSLDYVNISLLWDGTEVMKVKVDDVAPVPEPATMLLLGVGLIGIAGASRKKLFKK